MQKNRILQYRPYHIPWWKAVNWEVPINLMCWFLFLCAVIAISGVILFGGFLREIYG